MKKNILSLGLLFRLLLLSLALGVVVLLVFYVSFSRLFYCYALPYSSFRTPYADTYISPKIPPSLHPLLFKMVQTARKRVHHFWGSTKARPVLVFCADEAEFAYFGRNYGTPAMVNLNPLGTYIIVLPDGANIDVLSHEISHAELYSRLGWYTKMRQIPAWFDEGLALMVDYRYPGGGKAHQHADYRKKLLELGLPGSRPIGLSELRQIEDFFARDTYHTHRAYLTAGQELSRWLDQVKVKGLLQLIDSLKAGKDFMQVYAHIEKMALK
ncbi:MAG: hypothetical protein HC913_10325 [Microscillaceae bacterium]|nr:hypothetical protein [Microscillaceae bacterium]